VAMSQQWENREIAYARLSELANVVNAPGNDVFDSRNVAAERGRLRAALGAYNAHVAAVRAELEGVTPSEANRLQGAFDEIERAMQEMTAEAELIFGYFAAGEAERAGERMATMDRKYAGVLRAFARLFGAVRTIRHAHFEEQVRAAEWLKRVEQIVLAMAILMIAGALFYGSRLSRAARAAETERNQHIEALRRARVEADAANRAKSSFLASVSHEIRTPLNSIFLTLDMLEHPRSTEERRACIAVARASGRSLKRLIDDLLDVSRIESGRITFERVRFDPEAVVRELLTPYETRAAIKGVRMLVHVAPEVPPAVEGDPTRFAQILGNLVDNAVKFTASGSVDVSVALRAPENGAAPGGDVVPLCVTVRDSGIGLSAAQQERIFEDFVQGDDSIAGRFGGIGLGLGIVRRLVELMNGKLGVLSSPGGGSTFWFELDLAVAGPEPAATPPTCEWRQLLAGRSVLLVEDVAASRMLTAAVLRDLGMQVVLASSGDEALDAVRAHRYDAVLLDLGLPEMDGFEAARRIRALEAGGLEVPIIALTALVSDGVFEQCLDAGMDDYLAKPVTRDEMVAALCRWIEPKKPDGGNGN
jgi:signal transduction histidine kinase/CheY-like chemotaxis protein